jgi:hypothetical protein
MQIHRVRPLQHPPINLYKRARIFPCITIDEAVIVADCWDGRMCGWIRILKGLFKIPDGWM